MNREEDNFERRAEGIDGLRAFACLAIVCWHVYANGKFNMEGFFVEKVIPSWDYFVYLFMMISGFGIFNGYYKRFKSKQIDINEFYKRRYSKIFPFFALLVLVDVLIERSIFSCFEGFMDLTLLFGFLPNNGISVIGVAWTLGIIFVFYIAFPFFVFLFDNKPRAWCFMAISIIVQILCNVYFMTEKFVGVGYRNRQSFLFCLPFFAAGGIIYLYKKQIIEIVNHHSIMVGVICCIATSIYFLFSNQIEGYSILEIKLLVIYVLWLCWALGTKSKFFSNKVTKFISKISMEIYLSHMIFFRVIEKTGLIRKLGMGWQSYIIIVILMIVVMSFIIPIFQKCLLMLERSLMKTGKY